MNKALQKARVAAKLSRRQLEAEAQLGKGAIYDLETLRSKVPAYDSGVRILRVLESKGVDPKLLSRIFPIEEVGARR